jgi:hypothetical protein
VCAKIGNQTSHVLLVYIRHAFIRATTRPMVRTETPKTVAHTAWLLPALRSFRTQASALVSSKTGRPPSFPHLLNCACCGPWVLTTDSDRGCTDRYARWCGRGWRVTTPLCRSNADSHHPNSAQRPGRLTRRIKYGTGMYSMQCSTAQAARKVGIGRQTLHRWIRERSVSPPRRQKVAGVTVRIWTAEDIERLRKYKEENYRKGRGRKPQNKNGNR